MYRYFSLAEFDSPDRKGSGQKMRAEFMRRLDEARHLSGTSFKIVSGYRTTDYNNDLIRRGYKASVDSAHLTGWAADIDARSSAKRHKVLKGLISAGFNRIGIASTFIHADAHPTKPAGLIWTYQSPK